MSQRLLSLVVDGSIELPAERLQELQIRVVPREALLGRKKFPLDQTQTASTLISEIGRPRKLSWRSPSVDAFKETYLNAGVGDLEVFAFHPPVRLDEGIKQARLARNLLPSQQLHIYELPLLGLGFSRFIDVLARFALQGLDGADLTALIRFINARIKMLFLLPGKNMGQLLANPPVRRNGRSLKSLWGASYYLCELRAEDGRFQLVDQEQDLIPLVDKIGQLVTRMDSRRVPLEMSWRESQFEKQRPQFLTAVQDHHITHEEQDGWSPLLTSLLGTRYIEICLAPNYKDLVNMTKQYKLRLDAARKSRGEEEPKRLSDYRVNLR